MKVAISAIRTKDMRINRHELVTKMQELGHSVIYLGQESEKTIHSDYKKLNIQFLSVPLGRSNTNPIKELKSIKDTTRVLKNNNIEALIVYGIRTFPTMVIAAKLARVKKVLCIVNGSGRLFRLKGVKGFFVKGISYPMLWLSFLLSNKILFQNQDDLNMIKRKKLLLRKNYAPINGSGVNLDEYKFSKLEINPTFLMISRLTGSKGVNEYIRAASEVRKKYPKAAFNLVGPMDDNDFSINMHELNNAVEDGTINLIGKVEDVKPYISQCRVFVLPSYYPEGVPRSILEAMAMGRPILTTNSPGCKETVVNQKNGYLVSPKNWVELSEKMIWMIENPEKTEEMGKYSRELAKEKFNVYKINNMMLNAIDL